VSDAPASRCGYVAIVGRPNVGKSTLLNHLLGQKLSITSRKPQTTRHRLLGIHTRGAAQLLLVDTPGVNARAEGRLQRALNRTALGALADVDAVLLVVEAGGLVDADEFVLGRLAAVRAPVVCAINKVDRLADPSRLLPLMAELAARRPFADIVPVSARRGHALDRLADCLAAQLPHAPHAFPGDQVTDRDERFLVAEIVREKLVRRLGDEVPHRCSVVIEAFADPPEEAIGAATRIAALIVVERQSQKAIVIGSDGERLKAIGSDARRDIEVLLGRRVFLSLWVRVQSGWTDDERALRGFGLA
jgi:GTP-binding protein Era